MSYVVDVTDKPKWFINAWRDAFKRSPRDGSAIKTERSWDRLYPDYVYKWGGDFGPTTITFPDEQSYIWFRLKWS